MLDMEWFVTFLDLPKAYIFKMVSMRFADPKPETPFPVDENQIKKLSKREYTRLKKSHSSFKYEFSMFIGASKIYSLTDVLNLGKSNHINICTFVTVIDVKW